MTPDVVATPPRWAERLLRWSLAPDERAAVLGDVQEEFAAIADNDPARAVRWYWRQTLTSVVPNIARQIRNQWAEARHVVDEKDRRARRSRLIWGLGLLVVSTVFGTLAAVYQRHAEDWLAGGMTFAILAALLSLSSRYQTAPAVYSSKRGGWSLTLLVVVNALMVTHYADDLKWTLWVVIVWLWMWPRGMWPFRRPLPTREYFFRSPVVTYQDRADNSYDVVAIPAAKWQISSVIVGPAEPRAIPDQYRIDGVVPMSATIARTFTADQSLRFFAIVSVAPEQLSGSLEIRRASTNRVIATLPAAISVATPRPQYRPPHPLIDPDTEPALVPDGPMGEVNAVVSLAGLAPDDYVFRLGAGNGDKSVFQDTDITVRVRELLR